MSVPAYVFLVSVDGVQRIRASARDLTRDTTPTDWDPLTGAPAFVTVVRRLCATCWSEHRLIAAHGHGGVCWPDDQEVPVTSRRHRVRSTLGGRR